MELEAVPEPRFSQNNILQMQIAGEQNMAKFLSTELRAARLKFSKHKTPHDLIFPTAIEVDRSLPRPVYDISSLAQTIFKRLEEKNTDIPYQFSCYKIAQMLTRRHILVSDPSLPIDDTKMLEWADHFNSTFGEAFSSVLWIALKETKCQRE